MTFPGESQLFGDLYGPAVDSTALFDALRARNDGQSATVSAGDSFAMAFYETTYLARDDDAVLSLVVTPLSGSAVLRVTYGTDPDYNLGGTRTLAGDLTVSGTGEVAIQLGFTVPSYWDQAVQHVVEVEVLSGAVTLDNLRLRIWPPGGPVGGFSETRQRADPLGPFTPSVRMFTAGIPDVSTGELDAPTDLDFWFSQVQETARQNLAASPSYSASTGSGMHQVGFTNGGARAKPVGGNTANPIGTEATAYGLALSRGYISRTPVQGDPEGVEGVDWVRHPNRTRLDPDANGDIDGAPTMEWTFRDVTIGSGTNFSEAAQGYDYGFPLATSYYVDFRAVETIPDASGWAIPAGPSGSVRLTVEGIPADYNAGETGRHYAVFTMPDLDAEIIEVETSNAGCFAPYAAVPAYNPQNLYPDPSSVWDERRSGSSSGSLYAGVWADEANLFTGVGMTPVQYISHPAPYRAWVLTGAAPPIPRQWRSRPDGLAMSSAPSWRRSRDTVHDGQWRGVV